jgi:hypothetical protein
MPVIRTGLCQELIGNRPLPFQKPSVFPLVGPLFQPLLL